MAASPLIDDEISFLYPRPQQLGERVGVRPKPKVTPWPVALWPVDIIFPLTVSPCDTPPIKISER
jgi:hypothetical protein